MSHRIETIEECAWAYRYIINKLLTQEWTDEKALQQARIVDDIRLEIAFKNFEESL